MFLRNIGSYKSHTREDGILHVLQTVIFASGVPTPDLTLKAPFGRCLTREQKTIISRFAKPHFRPQRKISMN
jgi:hypothetical protein